MCHVFEEFYSTSYLKLPQLSNESNKTLLGLIITAQAGPFGPQRSLAAQSAKTAQIIEIFSMAQIDEN